MSSAARRCSFDALVALALLVFICAVPGRAAAQVLYGSIVGDVKDSSGASMPGATVLVTNNNTGLNREAVTDGVGHFNLANLPAGIYSFKATHAGVQRASSRREVTVTINSVTRLDVSLEIGSMGDNVTVTAEPPTLQTETAEVHVRPARSGVDEPARSARRQLPAGLPHAAGFRPADQFAFDPEQPGAIAGIHGQRHERRSEQHAD